MSKKVNNIRKGMVISSLLLSALLIITVIVYLKAFINRSGDLEEGILSSSTGILAVVLIMLAIGAFLYTLVRSVRKNKNVAKLNEEYDIVFEQIAQYVGLSGLTFLEKRELNNEILSLFLEAQQDNKRVDEVIGSNYQSFADNMIEAYGVKIYFLYDILSSIQYLVLYLVAGQYMMSLKYNGNYFNGKMDYTTILFFVLISFTILPMLYKVKRNIIKQKFQDFNNVRNYLSAVLSPMIIFPIIIIGVFILIIEVLIRFFDHIRWVSFFLYGSIVVIPSPLILGFLLLLVVLLYYLKRKMRRIIG